MLFINCHTQNYSFPAQHLKKSLDKFSLPYKIEVFPDRGSWVENCAYKAEFILKNLIENDSIVWLDADCIVHKNPSLFYEIKSDIGFHKFRGHELLSGTLFFNNTHASRSVVESWILLNEQNPNVWDQRNLAKAVKEDDGLEIYELPPEYCFIFDLGRQVYGELDPVIEHFQASRRIR